MALNSDITNPVASKQELFQKFFYINKKDIRPVINRIISRKQKTLNFRRSQEKKTY